MNTGILLILVYTGMSIVTEPQQDMESCIEATKTRFGEKAKVLMWDDMNGSNPIPQVAIAFCVHGSVPLQ